MSETDEERQNDTVIGAVDFGQAPPPKREEKGGRTSTPAARRTERDASLSNVLDLLSELVASRVGESQINPYNHLFIGLTVDRSCTRKFTYE